MATASKNERLDLRLPAGQKKTIKRTAALSGQTVSNFVLGTVVRRSRKVIREAETVVVSDRDRKPSCCPRWTTPTRRRTRH